MPAGFQENILTKLFQSAEPDEKIEPPTNGILFVGDIMMDRHVRTLMNRHGEDYPYQNIYETLENSDFVVANLEAPIIKGSPHNLVNNTVFSTPPSTPRILKENNIHLVSLANNHTLDFGINGLEQTRSYLDTEGILHAGHPSAVDESSKEIIEYNDKEIAFFSFNNIWGQLDTDAAVETIKEENDSKRIIIVAMHWGTEYSLKSNKVQQELAHRFIDAGADIIIGHHPHVVQEIEEYNGKMIFYSLGNFVFDQYFSNEVQQELAVNLKIQNDTFEFTLIPIQSHYSQISLMDGYARESFLNRLASRSLPSLSTQIQLGKITK